MSRATGPSLVIELSPAQLDRARSMLDAKQYKQATFQAVKRTVRAGVTQIKKLIRAVTYLKPKYIDRAIVPVDPKGEPPVGVIRVSRKYIPATGYKTRESKGGVTIQTLKNKSPVKLRHAFLATVKATSKEGEVSEHKGIFLREKGRDKGGKLTKSGYARRLHIKQKYGPPVIDLIEFPAAFEEIQVGILGTLEKNLLSQIDRFTK